MIKIGIIGAGTMGTSHAKSMVASPLLKLVAVSDLQINAAERLAQSAGAKAYDSYEVMLEQGDLDAVIVATPDNLHADPVIRAAECKKAILCEKPFATTTADGRRMLAAIRKNNVTLQMAHLFRFLPFYINMNQAVKSGNLGDILSLNVIMQNKIVIPTKMLKWANASSPAWFLLSHAIDAILWINGCRAETVSAIGIKKKLVSLNIDTYDIVKANLKLENGAYCTLEADWILPNTMPITATVKFELSGTEGHMSLNTGDPIETKVTNSEYSIPGILEYEVGGYYTGLHRTLLESFARTCEFNAPLVSSEVDGFNTLCVLEAIDRSMDRGGETIIPDYSE